MSDLNRYAISALGKNRKDEALNEEIIAHKKTGEFLIKTPEGNVISYSSMSRFKTHVNLVESYVENLEVVGSIFEITPVVELPEIIPDNTNIIDSPVSLEHKISKLLLSIDMDCVEINDLDTTMVVDEPDIKADFKHIGGTNSTFSITRRMSEFNKTAIVPPDNTHTGIQLTGITIIPNALNIDKTIQNIIHNIIIAG